MVISSGGSRGASSLLQNNSKFFLSLTTWLKPPNQNLGSAADYKFKRIQFPISHAFAMTINKSQSQSLSVCVLNLENECFSHGQLYVARLHVGKN